MIPANKKKNFTELPESLSNQIQSTFQSEEEKNVTVFIKPDHNEENNKKIIKEEIKTVTNSTENEIKQKKNDRQSQINICLPPEIKKEWKLLFTKNNVNITQGIIFAVEHLKNEIEKGEAVLTVGGVIKKM